MSVVLTLLWTCAHEHSGPEYNYGEPMQITVFGVDSPPTFAAPPAGGYKVMKTVTVSRVFERPSKKTTQEEF